MAIGGQIRNWLYVCRPSSAKKPDRHKGMAPIIIVPKGYDTKINMFNAQVRIYLQSSHVCSTRAWVSHSSHGSRLMAMLWAAL